ncbi:MAG: hypothetical protein COA79_00280 [Planctomycetota bacterium]|nr:MAG: hypothetical protein COA79_00280 [Planctomycetota bacterium]
MDNICPICNSDEIKFLFFKFDWNNKFDFHECKACHHKYVFPLPTSEELNLFYNKDYFVPPHQIKKVISKGEYAIKFCDNIEKGSFLEIGCSYGYFMDVFKGFGGEIEGVEISEKASEFSREKGFEVHNLDFQNFHLSKNYNGYFMFDVLEHLLSPLDILKKIDPFLTKGSQITLTIPNGNSIEFRLLSKYWEWSSPPAHLHFFTVKSIRTLFEKMGYEIEELHSYQGDASGNLFFNLIDGTKRMILFKLGFLIFGREKFLKRKYEYNLKNKEIEQENISEFSFINGLIHKVSYIFSPLNFLFRNKNNYPTLFVKAVK